MPPFQSLAGVKRKSDAYENPSRKRPTLGDTSGSSSGHSAGDEEYWMVQWRVPQTRKHKTWDGDGVLVANRVKATVFDIDNKILSIGKVEFPLLEGKNYNVSSKEIELDRKITRQEYLSGLCFGGAAVTVPISSSRAPTAAKQFIPPKISNNRNKPTTDNLPLQPLGSNVDDGDIQTTVVPSSVEESHWTANWRKQQNRKNKTWDGDAYVSLVGNKLTMTSEEGKTMGTCAWNGVSLHPGYHVYIGGKEVEIDCEVKASQLPTPMHGQQRTTENEMEPILSQASSPPSVSPPVIQKNAVPSTSFYGINAKPKPKGPLHDPHAEGAVVMKSPNKDYTKRFNKQDRPIVPVVLDPVLSRKMRPHQIEGVKFLYEAVMGMRKHEGQGCILADEMGLGKTLQTISLVWTLLRQNPFSGGASVVGKVLIVCPVSLVNNWKTEFYKWLGRDRINVVVCDKDKNAAKTFMVGRTQNVLIIGYERLRTVINDLSSCVSVSPPPSDVGVLALDADHSSFSPPIGLIICDEGHRLKSANNKTTAMFKALRTARRVILSGTPIQNDLSEFHAMADFCNPGLLDDYSTFRRVYEAPILKSRAPDATPKEVELGEARSDQLLTVAKSFVLRREATILSHYLPPKHEYVVFITPTALQLSIFTKILNPDRLDDLEHSSTAESLAMINMLTKVSNSPILLKATADKAKGDSSIENGRRIGLMDAVKLLPERAQIDDMSMSGKLSALARLLSMIRQHTEEKCVLVSHYTSTLNILEAYCKKKSYSYFRLDGQTATAKRQEYVNTFNGSSQKSGFIFLLSSKAGGVGINLIGASRLCLIDSDWNPSHDLQSMARCHRDGQKRPVYIYRFLTAGAIDEKIYQRQVTKLGLSNALMGSDAATSKSDSFSRKDLRDIFRIHPGSACNTHDLLDCQCDRIEDNHPPKFTVPDESLMAEESDEDDLDIESGFISASLVPPNFADKQAKADLLKKKSALAALGEWKHIHCLRAAATGDIQDHILRKLIYDGGKAREQTFPNPTSPIDALLSAVDLDNIQAMDETFDVRDVPGGTISFLFEKSSLGALEPTHDDDQ